MTSRHSLFALVALCGAASTAMAGTEPLQLSAAEMDSISAGASPFANILVTAGAVGDFAFAHTAGTAHTVATSVNNNPATAAYVGVAAGVGSATGLGTGAGTSTGVSPTVSVPGTNVLTYTINHRVVQGGTEINAGAVVKFGSFMPVSLLY